MRNGGLIGPIKESAFPRISLRSLELREKSPRRFAATPFEKGSSRISGAREI